MSLLVQKPADTRYAKVLLFSPGGHGKTHFLGTAQEDERTSPMLLLDFEGGDETLAGLDIHVARIRSWDDYNEAYELLTDPERQMEEYGVVFKSVGVDSISETHIWAILERQASQAPRRKDPDLVEIGDYGVAGTQLRRLMREFRDLPMHVFFTAGAKEITERGVGKIKVPSMSGAMAEEVVLLMSIVGYYAKSECDDGEMERVLILQNYPGFRTKVRAPWGVDAPDEIVDPTVTSLLDELGFGANPKPPTKSSTAKSRARRSKMSKDVQVDDDKVDDEAGDD